MPGKHKARRRSINWTSELRVHDIMCKLRDMGRGWPTSGGGGYGGGGGFPPGACPPGPQLCTAAEMLTTKAFAHPCCVHDCMSRAAARDLVSCVQCNRLITDIHNIVALAFAGKNAPVQAQQHGTVPRNTAQYRALPKGHIWVPSSPSGEHAHVHCAPLTLVSMLVCIAPP